MAFNSVLATYLAGALFKFLFAHNRVGRPCAFRERLDIGVALEVPFRPLLLFGLEAPIAEQVGAHAPAGLTRYPSLPPQCGQPPK